VSGNAGTYGYDYLGRRVWRTVVGSSATVQTHYIFDEAGHLLAEHNGATGAVLREYVWLDDTPLAMIDSTGTSPATYFIHTGQIEEPLVMTDATKAKVWDAYVEPFGKAQVFGTPSAGLDLRLPGQFTESEAGWSLSQNWNRNYDTSLGRYIQADPMGIEAGQNPYAYVEGDPLNEVDPLGLASGSVTVSVNGQPALVYPIPEIVCMIPGVSCAQGPPQEQAQSKAKVENCPPNKCPPCKPPVGTIAFRTDFVPPSDPHHPFPGDHTHLYQMNQNPKTCACYWNKLITIGGSRPPPGAVPLPRP
jgi:RHS repeat-associated protein